MLRADPTLDEIFRYQEEGILPSEDQKARLLVLNEANYTAVNSILYQVAPDHSLLIVPPSGDRYHLFQEAHEGKFSGHLGDAKVSGTLE